MNATERVVHAAKLARRARQYSRGEAALVELLHFTEPESCDALMDVLTTGGWEVPRGRIDSILDAYNFWRATHRTSK